MESPLSDSVHGAEPQSEINVTVAVLTYKRPEGITKLLEAMALQKPTVVPSQLSVLVVDNDPAGSGEATIEAFRNSAAHARGRFKLHYLLERRQGIPIARNAALDNADPTTDLFGFLDDDEWPVESWLDSLLRVRAIRNADCVYGPVEPVYPENAPAYFVRARVFERKKNQDGQRIGYAASNNVLFDYQLVRSWGLRFEEKMRYTGGTDYLFFNQGVRKGMKIFWAEDAVVYDIVPRNRMTWKWVLQRQYRLGNTFAVSEMLHGSRKAQFKRLVTGVARTGLGLAMLPSLAVSPYWGMRALTHILRGAGMAFGIMGHSYKEYKPEAIE